MKYEQHKSRILPDIAEYYSAKIDQYGETPSGVDWNGFDSQMLRFTELIRVIEGSQPFSLNDIGCGYGALVEVLLKDFESFTYRGNDISEKMVVAAQQRYQENSNIEFIVSHKPDKISDYAIASGIFNVRFENTDKEWCRHVYDTLAIMHETSSRGFSFNCLTKYSDAEKMMDYLFYADPCALFDYCKRNFSKQVALLHDYGLYEFTIIVRKEY